MIPVVLGVDPALGGGNSVIACGLEPNRLLVADIRVDFGLHQTEQQIQIIAEMARIHRPYRCIVEIDAQQKGLGNDERLHALAAVQGFSIEPHLTRMNKGIDQVFGVASMNQSFVKGEISIPWADEQSKKRMEPLVRQLRAWRPDVPTKKLQQDAVMSLWFVWRYWMQTRAKHEPRAMPQWRPSFMLDQPVRL